MHVWTKDDEGFWMIRSSLRLGVSTISAQKKKSKPEFSDSTLDVEEKIPVKKAKIRDAAKVPAHSAQAATADSDSISADMNGVVYIAFQKYANSDSSSSEEAGQILRVFGGTKSYSSFKFKAHHNDIQKNWLIQALKRSNADALLFAPVLKSLQRNFMKVIPSLKIQRRRAKRVSSWRNKSRQTPGISATIFLIRPRGSWRIIKSSGNDMIALVLTHNRSK